MFWTRSDYFRALIDDHFHEGSFDTLTDRLILHINNVSPEVFAVVVSHIYSNVQQVLDPAESRLNIYCFNKALT